MALPNEQKEVGAKKTQVTTNGRLAAECGGMTPHSVNEVAPLMQYFTKYSRREVYP